MKCWHCSVLCFFLHECATPVEEVGQDGCFYFLLANIWSGCGFSLVFLVWRSSQIVANIAMAQKSHLGHLKSLVWYITNTDLDTVSQKRWENEWRIKRWIFPTRLCCSVHSWKSESGPPARSSVSVYTHVLISTLRSELLRNDSSIFVLITYLFHNFPTNPVY